MRNVEELHDLKNRLWNTEADYSEGIIAQNYGEIMRDCRMAADVIEGFEGREEFLTEQNESSLKRIEEYEHQLKRLRSDNEILKECVVRMCLGRYGVLNE